MTQGIIVRIWYTHSHLANALPERPSRICRDKDDKL